METIFAFIIIGIICFVAGFIVSSCISYRKAIKEELLTEKITNTKSYEISMDDLEKFIEGYTREDKPFDCQVMEWLSNTNEGPNLIETADPNVDCIGDCEGSECPCFPAREDCCENFKTGNCKVTININQLCGIEDYKRNPDLLTRKEAETLANLLVQYLNKK